MHYIETEEVMHFSASDFTSDFIIDLERDLQKLCYLQKIWKSIKTDPKLIEFKNELKNNPVLTRSKKIVFTESRETAQYLVKNLEKMYGERIVSYSGDSDVSLKREIEYSFNPKFMKLDKDKFDILITTDVLAEGINLHRSNVIINYDLPWNPTKIMQRVGRINRVGTAFDRIYVFNFFPTAQASKQLPLTDRILEKLQAFHDTLGEDYKFLSEEENPTPQKLFHDLSQNMDEEQEASPELQYLAIIREVRDDNPQMFNKIKRLPKKSKTGRNSTAIHEDSTLTFIRKGALKSFYISDNLNTIALSFMDAIHYLECDSDEKKVAVGSAYYNHYQSNSHSFDETLTAEKVITRKKVTVRGNDATVVKALKAILDSGQLTDDQEDIAKCIIQAIENGDIPKNATKEIVKQIKAATNVISAFAIIRENIDDTYLYDRKDVVLPDEGKKEVILSCYMKKQE